MRFQSGRPAHQIAPISSVRLTCCSLVKLVLKRLVSVGVYRSILGPILIKHGIRNRTAKNQGKKLGKAGKSDTASEIPVDRVDSLWNVRDGCQTWSSTSTQRG